jgi:hypothetical protein
LKWFHRWRAINLAFLLSRNGELAFLLLLKPRRTAKAADFDSEGRAACLDQGKLSSPRPERNVRRTGDTNITTINTVVISLPDCSSLTLEEEFRSVRFHGIALAGLVGTSP